MFLIGLIVLFLGFFYIPTDPVNYQFYLGTASISLLSYLLVSRKTHPLPALLISYTLFLASYNGFAKWGQMALDPMAHAFISQSALMTGFLFMGGLALFLSMTHFELNLMGTFFGMGGFINALFVFTISIVARLMGKTIWGHGGFLDVSGMNACLISVLVPFLPIFWVVILASIIVFLAQSTNPVFVFFVMAISFIGFRLWKEENCRLSKQFWNTFTVVVFLSTILTLVIASYGVESFFHYGDRFQGYVMYTKEVFRNGKWLMGFGLGSFRIVGPEIQMLHKFNVTDSNIQVWPWEHSDWLQIFFEMGLIGVTLYVAVFFWMLRQAVALRREDLFSSIMGYGAWMCCDYPFRNFLSAFLGIFLLTICIRENQKLRLTN